MVNEITPINDDERRALIELRALFGDADRALMDLHAVWALTAAPSKR